MLGEHTMENMHLWGVHDGAFWKWRNMCPECRRLTDLVIDDVIDSQFD